MTFTAPVPQIKFTLEEIVGLNRLAETGGFPDLSPDLTEAVLTEAGKLAEEVIAPLNWPGDRAGAKLADGAVTTAPGFKEAYLKFIEGGWGSIPFEPDYGGQGLPQTLAMATQELWQGANLAFGLAPLLGYGAIEALHAHGSEEQKNLFLPKLISGEWLATMNLTEPQAGSDVGALRTKAEPVGDGTYRITGNKIYITYGEHDFTDNIIHLVLARLPDAPAGTRGISLFLVPKFHVNPDGSIGERNDVKCVGLEEKLGIHASPTCTMAYGENGGAIGTLIGQENRGMACMFTMMNNARLAVGLQGVGLSEAALQHAYAYATDRQQGKLFGMQHKTKDMVPIIQHADVRRMLLDMKAKTEAARAICLANAFAVDMARVGQTEEIRRGAKNLEEFLTPIAKAWSTDMAVDVTSTGIQIHGGMGFVEETGAAQYFRDARITPIYEGTNGIQAIDLVTRKLPIDGGEAAKTYIQVVRKTAAELQKVKDPVFAKMGDRLFAAVKALELSTNFMLEKLSSEPQQLLAGATPYLRQCGHVAGAHYLGLGALKAAEHEARGASTHGFYHARIQTAAYFFANVLPEAEGLVSPVMEGHAPILEVESPLLAL